MAQVALCAVHVVYEVTKGDLRLDHPELGEVTSRVRVLGTEGRPKCIDRTKSTCEVLAVELPGHSEVRGLAKEVLRGMCADARRVEIELRSDDGKCEV